MVPMDPCHNKSKNPNLIVAHKAELQKDFYNPVTGFSIESFFELFIYLLNFDIV